MTHRRRRHWTRLIARVTALLALLALVDAPSAYGHGATLQKKGSGQAAQERGPHGGAVIDIGDGHLELVRKSAGAFSLYRVDDTLHAIPAEDVDSAVLHAVLPGSEASNWAMDKIGAAPDPAHFSVTPKGVTRGFLAVVTVVMGDKVQNLRFQVN